MVSRRAITLQLCGIGACALLLLLSCVHYWPQIIDDSFITFRFSLNLVEGHGIRFNPEGMRVEGFTNFLWMLMSAFWLALNFDVLLSAKVMGALSAIGTLVVAWRFTAALREREDAWNLVPSLLLAGNAHFAFWSVQGMETQSQVFFVLLTYHLFFRETLDNRQWIVSPIIAFLAVLNRIDSLWYLMPLPAWAVWQLYKGNISRRRFLITSLTVALPIILFFGWKKIYFGDLLPNTYYAKVVNEQLPKDRGPSHLYQFYFNQAGWETEDARFRLNGIAWMNMWMISLPLCVLFGGIRQRILIIAPILLQVIYILHVHGDWMPGFRFFQIALPFLFIAVPLSLDSLIRLFRQNWARISLFTVYVLLIVFTIVEQLSIETAYVFGRDPLWFEREESWCSPAELNRKWHMGFEPPLTPVSEEILLETIDDSWILMSDIGQPLWYATHLNLLDVDGLTDKIIANAPSARDESFGGDKIESVRAIEEWLADQQHNTDNEIDQQYLRETAEEIHREQVLSRAAAYVMEHHKPEYILAFEHHGDAGPARPGYVYPAVVARATSHPNFYTYEHIWQEVKTTGVWNHLYQREDVEAVSGDLHLPRLMDAIDRNPRIGDLAPPLYLALMDQENAVDAQERLDRTIRLSAANTRIMRQLLQLAAMHGDEKTARFVYENASKYKAADDAMSIIYARLLAKQEKPDMALQILQSAIAEQPDNEMLLREFKWMSEN